MTQTLSAAPNESAEPDPVSLRFRFDSESVEQFAERYASDVSRGGIFVHSRQPFPVGTQLKLNLQLLDGTPLIVGEGTVFWTREPDANKPTTIPGMGVRFCKLTSHSQRVIELVLSQRTGRERSGLFPTLGASVIVEETGRHPVTNAANPPATPGTTKTKLPFNMFPGRPIGTAAADDSRELLATAGREEATPLVGVSAATLADARPGKDEPPSRSPTSPARPIVDSGSGVHAAAAAGNKRNPPALALIKPATGEHKAGDKAQTEGKSGQISVTISNGRVSSATPVPTLTTTQELWPPGGANAPLSLETAPLPVGMSQSRIVAPVLAAATPARSSMRKKLIIGAAALLVVSVTAFATTRGKAPVAGNARGATSAATVVATSAIAGRQTTPPNSPPTAEPSALAPQQPAAEPEAPALEPEAPSATSNGKSSASSSSASSRIADRRAPSKGKPAAAHRPGDIQPAGRSSAPSEKPQVAEVPAHMESPGPAPTPPAPPPPAPAAVAVHAERPEPTAATKSLIPTVPPPVAAMAHKLRLTSIPSEAEVELDGKVIGKTPLFGVEVDVARPHVLTVRKEGFAPFKQTIGSGSEWSIRSAENVATLRIQAFMKKGGQ